jgi:hypothetical protein
MNLWSIMNWVAWGLSAFFIGLMLRDFIRVEKDRRKK